MFDAQVNEETNAVDWAMRLFSNIFDIFSFFFFFFSQENEKCGLIKRVLTTSLSNAGTAL